MNKKILVIEDEVVHSNYFKFILEKEGYEVTVASTIMKAKKVLLEQAFFVVFLDLNLPNGEGFRLMGFINKKQINTAVIVISVSKDPDSIIKSFKLRAVDYLIKLPTKKKLIAAINSVEDKKKETIPLLQRNLAYIFDRKLLTPREQEILGLIASGISYKDIVEKLFISQNTLKSHIKNIHYKLPCKCSGRTDIVYQLNCSDIKDHFNNDS